MELKVNPLPAKTWHWVKMNESELKIELPDAGPKVELKGHYEGLKFEDDRRKNSNINNTVNINNSNNINNNNSSWKDIETGMGKEFDDLMEDTEIFYLDIPERYVSDRPVVINLSTVRGGASGKILIHAGKNSALPVIIVVKGDDLDYEHPSTTETDGISNNNTVALQLKFCAEEGAKISLYVVQLLPFEGLSCIDIGGVCGSRAQTELTYLSLGSLKEYAGIAVSLKGDKSAFSADMGYRVRSSQRLDINYIARHTGKDSDSRMDAWGVLEDGSFKLFRGTIDFIEGCPGSVGKEKEDVLLLGDHQVNQTIPLILCHEEDVEGDHGATISRLDDQILFYLQTRGIGRETAENMVARARLEALIMRIPDEEVKVMTSSLIESSERRADE